MYSGWREPGAARMILIALALLGAIFLFVSVRGGDGASLSLWSPPGGVASASVANAASNSLVGVAQGRGRGADLLPQGNPLGAPNTVMTQGYGAGSHAPATVWGAVDLAIDGNGDGSADPAGSWQQPVYATHSGVVKLTPDSWPAGNHVWVTNDQYRSGYAHLAGFAVTDGQQVQPGDLIGYVGSSGQSSGPHLDYQVWAMQGGQWVNQNPLDFGALDGTQ